MTDHILLGGAERSRTRVRGFAPWTPRAYVEAFTRDLGGQATFTRLAVTPEQIAAHNLPTAPPKLTDNRAFHGETCQLEALAPDVLADILRRAIEERLDRRAYEKVLRQERKIRRELSQRLTV